MGGRAGLLMLLMFSACRDRSTVLDFSGDVLRIAVEPEASLERMVPSENMGAAGPASELFFESAESQLTVASIRGPIVELLPREKHGDLAALASALRFEGLVRVDVADGRVIAEFVDDERARAFVGAGGLAVGAYLDSAVTHGSRKLLIPRAGAPLAEFVHADQRSHWQLLVGGYVDVAPLVRAVDAERLKGFPTINIQSKPSNARLSLVLNPTRVTPRQRELLVSTGLTSATTDSLPAILYLASDAATLLQFRRFANERWRATGIRPRADPVADSKVFSQRVVAADFDALLGPVLTDPKEFLPWLQPGGSLAALGLLSAEAAEAIRREDWQLAASLVAEHIIPLEEIREYIAYSAEWCGDIKPEAYSWKWIADLRRCENEK